MNIEKSNIEATTRMIEARPVLVGLGKARDVIPGDADEHAALGDAVERRVEERAEARGDAAPARELAVEDVAHAGEREERRRHARAPVEERGARGHAQREPEPRDVVGLDLALKDGTIGLRT